MVIKQEELKDRSSVEYAACKWKSVRAAVGTPQWITEANVLFYRYIANEAHI